TASGLLVAKSGLSPFAKSAFAGVPTGTPRSPLFGAQKFTQPLPRLTAAEPHPMVRNAAGDACYPAAQGYEDAKRLSYHNDFNSFAGSAPNPFINPVSNRGPMEGRPHGEWFAHQRWDEFFPKAGYAMSWGPCAAGTKFHPRMPDQQPN